MPARRPAVTPDGVSSTTAQRGRDHPLGREQEQVRVGLAARHLLGGEARGGREQRIEPGQRERAVGLAQAALRGDADRDAGGGDVADQLGGAVERARLGREHRGAALDVLVEPAGRKRPPEHPLGALEHLGERLQTLKAGAGLGEARWSPCSPSISASTPFEIGSESTSSNTWRPGPGQGHAFFFFFFFVLCNSKERNGAVFFFCLLFYWLQHIVSGGTIYKAEWYAGDSAWSQGDNVILTNDDGRGQMVSPDDDDKLTEV